MQESSYSSMGMRLNKTFRNIQDHSVFTLKDFLENKFTIHNETELKEVFVRDLKNVLKKENIFFLIESFFDLETQLTEALDKLDLEEAILNFDEFYKNLSPVLMRALLENSKNSNSGEQVLKTIKEAIRVSLEEELALLSDV